MPQLSRYGICYEAIQRVYRNAVLAYARGVLPGFYSDWRERIKRAFGKEWAEIETNANERRLTGELSSELRDELDLLGVNHFYNLFEAFFDSLFPDRTRESTRARQQERQAVLSWAREIRALRDPMSHPSDEDIEYDDAFRMLDSACRLLRKIDSQAAHQVDEWRDLLDQHEPEEQHRSPLEGRLPSTEAISVRFVGRAVQLDELRIWFANPDSRRWALMGDGGKGKTAIAYEFACEIRDRAPVPFEFVVWLSAKRKRFDEGTIVDLPRPDCWDLDSALDWVLGIYGWDDERTRVASEKRKRCLELLYEFPALVVVDDIDSLEGEGEHAVEFFTVDVPATRSKVLLTSRRQLFGLAATTTVVSGFREAEGLAFIESRIRLLGLDSQAFREDARRRILKVADGSPLFIEDLLRLCAAGVPVNEAIETWQQRGGDEARRYALGRELDMLSKDARHVLAAAAASNGPVSLAEIVAVTGLHEDATHSAVGELQRLFILPKPRLIEEVERFDLNLNTRALVRTVMANTDLLRRCESGFGALSGDLLNSRYRRTSIGEFIRQAVGLVKQDRHEDAERTIRAGLEQFPNDPDLFAQLGWVYKAWKPQMRLADAREAFERARQLKCPDERLYVHWTQMEGSIGEWTRAAQAAECGLELHDGSALLCFHAGYARSRLAQGLLREMQPRAEDEALAAKQYLQRALKNPEQLNGYQERFIQSRTFRSLTLTLDILVQVTANRPGEARAHAAFAQEGVSLLNRWIAEHPDDQFARRESEFLRPRFASVLQRAIPRV